MKLFLVKNNLQYDEHYFKLWGRSILFVDSDSQEWNRTESCSNPGWNDTSWSCEFIQKNMLELKEVV